MFEVPCFAFYLFKFRSLSEFDFFDHAVFTRYGGVSKYPFNYLNVGNNVGDSEFCVQKNRMLIHKISGGSRSLYVRQIHGDRILVISKKSFRSDGFLNVENCCADAIITNIPGINIVIQTADCQAVILVDPVEKVIANIHVGWRGNVSCILGKSIIKMVEYFGCRPSNMVAALGPSLGPCCAEFKSYAKEFPKSYLKYKYGACNFNLWAISREQLCQAGLSLNSISCGEICTKCNSHLFFSYRKNKISGRFATSVRIRRNTY